MVPGRKKAYIRVGLVDQLDILAVFGESFGANNKLYVGENCGVQIIHFLKDILDGGVTVSFKTGKIRKHVSAYLHWSGVESRVDCQYKIFGVKCLESKRIGRVLEIGRGHCCHNGPGEQADRRYDHDTRLHC